MKGEYISSKLIYNKKMKKVIIIISVIVVVLVVTLVAYNIYNNNSNNGTKPVSNDIIEYTASKPEEASIEEYPDSVEIVDNIYSKVKSKNSIAFSPKNGEMMQEYITEYGFKNNRFEISVKVYYIKEYTQNSVTYYQLYKDKDFTNKLCEVSKRDYNEAVKDNSADGVNNYSLEGLINSNQLESYKYVFEYDSQNRKVTFKEFIKQ